MAVDFDAFVEWAENRFDDVITTDKEVKLNSFFCEEEGLSPDTGHHLWCNPAGGKWNRDNGVYRCFKTEHIGTLPGLVMHVDGCTYEEAMEILHGETPLRELEKRLEEFLLNKKKPSNTPELVNFEELKLSLPDHTFPIEELPSYSWHRQQAEDYLLRRKLPIGNLLVCKKGRYRNRIVIPYYDKEGRLIYWNARHIFDREPKYWGPGKEVGVGKSDVLFMPNQPPPGAKIYLTEGEFDALVLTLCGYYSWACGGKSLDELQIEMLPQSRIVLSFDNDDKTTQDIENIEERVHTGRFKDYGRRACEKVAQQLMKRGFPVSIIRPPVGYKDWNALLINKGVEVIRAYIEKYEEIYDEFWAEKTGI